MKRFFILILLAAAFLLGAQTMTIESITGKVQVAQTAGQWADASVGQAVSSGAMISTGFKSTAALNTGDAVINVAQLTRITLEELVEDQDSVQTTLFLNGGRVNAEVSRERIRQDFTVRSPIATASVRGTGFDFDGRNLNVHHGAVLISRGGRSVLAIPGDYIRTGANGPLSRKQSLALSTTVTATVAILQNELTQQGQQEILDLLQNSLLKDLKDLDGLDLIIEIMDEIIEEAKSGDVPDNTASLILTVE
ncbi:MAG: FecR domain-containing protein [Spirochaetaceae bacterium]|jgi:hypothetical protein|nr:FecR domain-containing protein [Spirochaetaceae bacterium]